MKHKIIAIDAWVPMLPLDLDAEVVEHRHTDADDVPARIKDATIVVTSATAVSRAAIEGAPHLQLIACNSVGTDKIDKDAARERNVTVTHVPGQSEESVAEHAWSLFYAVRRKTPYLHNLTMDGTTWGQHRVLTAFFGPPSRTNSEETLVVVGYGAIGKRIEKMATALGMRVLVAERKGADDARPGRVAFDEALKTGTAFILAAPLEDSSRHMFASAEFAAMDSTATIVNIGRGGLINEKDLAEALRNGTIGGAATDVFAEEPATPANCPLLDPSIPNLVLSPHLGWYSSQTIKNILAVSKANIECFAAGKPQNVVVPSR